MKSAAQPVSCKNTVMWHNAIRLAEGRWEGSGGKNLKLGRFFFLRGWDGVSLLRICSVFRQYKYLVKIKSIFCKFLSWLLYAYFIKNILWHLQINIHIFLFYVAFFPLPYSLLLLPALFISILQSGGLSLLWSQNANVLLPLQFHGLKWTWFDINQTYVGKCMSTEGINYILECWSWWYTANNSA